MTTDVAPAWWVSWYAYTPLSEFELHSPWWVSGYGSDDSTVMVAAVRAADEEAAFAQVRAAYDNDPGPLVERFCEPLTRDTPFTSRFPQAAWMEWDGARTCRCTEHSGVADE